MSILDDIVRRKRDEIAAALPGLAALEEQARAAAPPLDFLAALRDPPGVRIIAEIKRASPALGAIAPAADIVAQARAYEAHGAACVSVLTDGPFFQGSLADLRALRAAIRLPLLRKDFILDRVQILEARANGADAILLIAEILTDAELRALREEAERWGLAALVECYAAANLERLLASGATLVGVNNRDLRTFETKLEHTLALAPQIPPGRLLVSESGIRTGEDVRRLAAAGAKAILVGETLMKSGDLAATFAALRG